MEMGRIYNSELGLKTRWASQKGSGRVSGSVNWNVKCKKSIFDKWPADTGADKIILPGLCSVIDGLSEGNEKYPMKTFLLFHFSYSNNKKTASLVSKKLNKQQQHGGLSP
jgi:hypothetical protein